MKVVVAMDSFKGSLSSLEVGEAIKEGIRKAVTDAKVWVRPLFLEKPGLCKKL